MANINKIITLSSWGGSSGPLYNAYYSTDNINFTIAISGSNLYLPSIGSSATIIVPDTTNYIKLINDNEVCGEASASIYAGPTTTSTSTTSTSTTTEAPNISRNGLTIWNRCSSLSGSIWKDVSGNNNDALISGSLPLVLSGSLGVEFVSSSSNPTYLTYSSSLVASPSSSFTLQLFGSPKGNVGKMHLFGKTELSASVYSNGWWTGWNGTIGAGSRMYYYDNLTEEVIVAPAVPEATRSLYTFVFNEGTGNNGMLYVNNNISYSFSGGPYVGFNTASTAPFTFGFDAGNDVSGAGSFGSYVGTVNDIIVYNRAITQNEINQNYFYITSQSCVIP